MHWLNAVCFDMDSYVVDLYSGVNKGLSLGISEQLSRLNKSKYKDLIDMLAFRKFKNRKPNIFFIKGDFFGFHERDFDLVTSYQNFWLFNCFEAAEAVAGMLKPSGLFAMFTPYFWFPRSTLDSGYFFGGGFPFFEQRLGRKDLEGYYRQHKPEHAPLINRFYSLVDPHRPTVETYRAAFERAGFSVLSTRRVGGKTADGGFESFFDVGGEHYTSYDMNLNQILDEIQLQRPDVVMDDLLTRGLVLVAQKI